MFNPFILAPLNHQHKLAIASRRKPNDQHAAVAATQHRR
jgi:hypothetical protein